MNFESDSTLYEIANFHLGVKKALIWANDKGLPSTDIFTQAVKFANESTLLEIDELISSFATTLQAPRVLALLQKHYQHPTGCYMISVTYYRSAEAVYAAYRSLSTHGIATENIQVVDLQGA